jgi:hypothetical protein
MGSACDPRWRVPAIDTTPAPVEAVVERLAGWVLMQQHLGVGRQAPLQGGCWEHE